MNKELKKAKAMIEEKKRIQAATIETAEAELAKIREKLAQINAELVTAADAETYKKLYREKDENEAALDFFTKRKAVAQAQLITPAEKKSIIVELNKAYEETKKRNLQEITASAKKLYSMTAIYGAEVDELNAVATELNGLCPGEHPIVYSAMMDPNADLEVIALMNACSRARAGNRANGKEA